MDNAGNLYVADSNNARALMYKNPIANDTTADIVFGQNGSFTSSTPNNGGVNGDTLETPTDIDADGAGNVYITDTGTERTIEYDNPVGLGTTGDVVFGQGGNLSSFGNNFGGLGTDSQADPWAIDFDKNCNIYISDYGNNRVLEYDKPPHACIDAPLPTPTPTPLPTAPVPTTAPVNTSTGVAVAVSLNGGTAHSFGVNITFATVNSAGQTTANIAYSGPPAPSGRKVMGFGGHGGGDALLPTQPVYYEISTTASISGIHQVCMSFDPSQAMPGTTLQLMHYTGTWTNITNTVDNANHVICGSTASFSPFAVMSSTASNPVGGVTEVFTSSDGSSGPPGVIYALGALTAVAAAAWFAGRRRLRTRP